MSELETVATFNTTTKRQIRSFYENRCAFCLDKLSEEGSQCAHILDSSKKGASQVTFCSQLGIIPEDYKPHSEGNGIILCARCHLGFFTDDLIALCPPKEVLEYLVKYVQDTPAGERMSLYQVIYELISVNPLGIPDASAVLPFIGLFVVLHLKPTQLRDLTLSSTFFPPLSILRNGQWQHAPTRTAPTTPNVARIFDALALNASGQDVSPGRIPLHPDQADYSRRRYWRLPKATLGGILSAAVLRAATSPSEADDELAMVKRLYILLMNNRIDAGLSGNGSAGPSDGSGSRGGRGGDGDGGGRRRGRRGTSGKRANEDGHTHPSKRRHVHPGAIDDKEHSSEYNPAKWEFGPDQSTNTVVFHATNTVLDPAYFHAWVRQQI